MGLREEVMSRLESSKNATFGEKGNGAENLEQPKENVRRFEDKSAVIDAQKEKPTESQTEEQKPEGEKKAPDEKKDYSKMTDDEWLDMVGITDTQARADFKARTMMRKDYTQKRMKESDELKQVETLKAEIEALRKGQTDKGKDNRETTPDLNDPVVKQIEDLKTQIRKIQETENLKSFQSEKEKALEMLSKRGLRDENVSDELYLSRLAEIGEANPHISITDAAKIYIADHIDEAVDKISEARARERAEAVETPRMNTANLGTAELPAGTPTDPASFKEFVLKRSEQLKKAAG